MAKDVSAGTIDVKIAPEYDMPQLDAPSMVDNAVTWQFGKVNWAEPQAFAHFGSGASRPST